MNDLITVNRAAEIAGVDPKTIRRWYRERRITRFRTQTNRVRVSEAEIRRLTEPEPVP